MNSSPTSFALQVRPRMELLLTDLRSMGLIASMARKVVQQPIVFVNGATGTGKSDLAISLAKRFAGEVVNSDAMQLYQGLPIVTNKATEAEQEGIPHHMMSILEPDNLSYTIHNFKSQAQQVISDIQARGNMPIVVGGTNYYLDSLLWESLIPQHESPEAESSRFTPDDYSKLSSQTRSFLLSTTDPKTPKQEATERVEYDKLSETELCNLTQEINTTYLRLHTDDVNSSKLHDLLMVIDPTTALSLHPNTVRKIIRAVEVFKIHGRPQSSFHSDLNSTPGEQAFSAKLCYHNAIVLWLNCQQEVLDERLRNRVNKMLDRGLIQEVDNFNKEYNEKLQSQPAEYSHCDFTRGVFQCIGFKELYHFLQLTPEERQTKHGQKILNEGVERMKNATRRYAKYQNKWVKKRMFEERNPKVAPPVYSFDSSDVSKFTDNVVNPAISIIEKIMCGETPTENLLCSDASERKANPTVFMRCEACDVICVRKAEWDLHITSRKHRKRLASVKRQREQLDEKRLKVIATLEKHEAYLRKSNI